MPAPPTTSCSPMIRLGAISVWISTLTNLADALYYCSATPGGGDCGTPCPSGHDLGCPPGQRCYGPQLHCQQQQTQTLSNSNSGNYYCGRSMLDAQQTCSQRCLGGSDPSCGEGKGCWAVGNACEFADLAMQRQSASNPHNFFCGASYADAVDQCFTSYFAVPCPPTLLEIGLQVSCPPGQYCYGNLQCNPQVGGSTAFAQAQALAEQAAASQAAASNAGSTTSAQAAMPNVPALETQPAATAQIASNPAPQNAQGALQPQLWCATSYKHLLENCPKRCTGPDDDCGTDENGDQMSCFNMQFEKQPCTTEGVGIGEPVNSEYLWCGSSWLQLTENCQKPCPFGSNEECGRDSDGNLMICYDMSDSNEVCQTAGVGIKEKADPSKRFCGTSYEAMVETCPLKCPDGTCPDGMVCFEDTPCKEEGIPSPAAKDTSSFYCGKNYADATQCGTPCPEGSDTECPGGQRCYSHIKCKLSGKEESDTSSSNLLTEVPAAAAKPAPAQATKLEAQPAEEEQQALALDPPAPVVAGTTSASTQTVVAKDIRMSMSGMDEFSVSHLVNWERHTADYFDAVFNILPTSGDSISDAVKDVTTSFDITEVNLSSMRQRRRHLRSERELSSSYLLTYTQTTRYTLDKDISVEQVLQYPFSSAAKRDDYVNYLKAAEPALFEKLTAATVYLPVHMGSSITVTTEDVPQSASLKAGTSSNTSSHPLSFGSVGTSQQAASTNKPTDQPSPSPSKQPTPFPTTKVPTPAPSTAQPMSIPTTANPTNKPSTANPTKLPTIQPSTKIPTKIPTSQPSTGIPTKQPTDQPVTAASSLVSTALLDSDIVGPTDMNGLEMTLNGISLIRAEHIFEWQYLTGHYVQDYYAGNFLPPSYIRSKIHGLSTSIEITNISFGKSDRPSTTITFKQTITYKSKDSNISNWAVIMQPFLSTDYRDTYMNYLKNFLPAVFEEVDFVSSIASTGSLGLSYMLTETFFCGKVWPVSCTDTLRCENSNDCPIGYGCFTSLPGCTESVDEQEQLSMPDISNNVQIPQPTPNPSSWPTNQPVTQRPSIPYHSSLNQTPQPSHKPTSLPTKRPVTQQPSSAKPTPSPTTRPTKENPVLQPLQQPPKRDPGSAFVSAFTASKPISEHIMSSSVDEDESGTSCNLCVTGQISRNVMVKVNGKRIDCSEAENMITAFTEGSASCVSARSSMSHGCCFENQEADTSTSYDEEVMEEIVESKSSASHDASSSSDSQPTLSTDTSNDENPHIIGSLSSDSYQSSDGKSSGSNSDKDDHDWYTPELYSQWQSYKRPRSNSSQKWPRIGRYLAIAMAVSFYMWLSFV